MVPMVPMKGATAGHCDRGASERKRTRRRREVDDRNSIAHMSVFIFDSFSNSEYQQLIHLTSVGSAARAAHGSFYYERGGGTHATEQGPRVTDKRGQACGVRRRQRRAVYAVMVERARDKAISSFIRQADTVTQTHSCRLPTYHGAHSTYEHTVVSPSTPSRDRVLQHTSSDHPSPTKI